MVEDLPAEPESEFPIGAQLAKQFGSRTVLATPLLREGTALGAIVIRRSEARPFSDKQIKLLETFADQAVIAIENVRLFNELEARNRELTESLEQQTATAEILRVISSSPTDLAPVFDAVARSVSRLCDAPDVVIARAEGDVMRFAASVGPFGETFGPELTVPIARGSVAGRALLERRTIQIDDLAAESEGEYPEGKALQRRYGHRTMVAAPLLFGDTALGAIVMLRKEVKPFSDKQLALLRTFADQAVIAIQNVRLFNETKEALDQQKASADVLQVISSSVADTKPVFDKILESCGRLFEGQSVGISLVGEDGAVHLAAYQGAHREELERHYPVPLSEDSGAGAAILQRRVVHYPDARDGPDVPEYMRRGARITGYRSAILAPMLWEGRGIGAIFAWRAAVGEFSEKEIALLKTFADQAVIAIQNARLFNETKEALDQQRASAEVLQVISSSVADAKPVFDKILESCERLFGGRHVGINLIGEDGAVHLGPYRGPGRQELAGIYPLPLTRASASGAAILERRVMHYPDVEGGADVPEPVRRGGRIMGFKSFLFAPMLWKGRGIGAIWVGRDAIGEFSEKEIALLKTFADQAVIAIQNAKLFREIQEKSHQLEIANQHKSAFLANMSHELRTPLNAVIGFSEMLAARYFGQLTEKQAEYVKDIHGSGKHLLSLINDILDLSKIEAGRMELEAADFDLRAALDNALTLVRERAQRSGIALRFEADPELGPFRGDERKVKQVILNLLSNAVKFTPRGGAVGVVARQANGSAEIAVKDTGVGIAPADQETIFEAFRQVGTDVTRKREGTGLGLALARRFVELHGGTIRVESAPGKGSTFTVTLPVRNGE
ncbi:MAG TPA: GAF domain-containing protein [Candidatus Sulfotelmatobacter sp.]|nr:GAF domain-containing protein [Candidatus Sulfotelmatobacter sp.]